MTIPNMRNAARWAAAHLVFVLVLTTVAVSAWGNQHAKQDNLYKISPFGFSKDGRIFAYIIGGMEEKGSEGRYFARLYFLDVHKNSFLKPKRIVAREENSGGDPSEIFERLTQMVVNKGDTSLAKYKIQEYPGEMVKVTRGKRKKRNFFTYKGKKFELRLIPKTYRVKRCGKMRTRIFTLALLGGGGQMNILQRDKKLYRSRGCPVDYTVHETAFIHKNGIVAFVYSTTPSRFGGKPHKVFKPLVVSGSLGKGTARTRSAPAAVAAPGKGGPRDPSRVTGRLLRTFKAHNSSLSLAISPDGRFLLSGSGDYETKESVSLMVWEMATGRKLRTIKTPGSAPGLLGVAFFSNGRVGMYAVGGGGWNYSIIKIFEVSTGREVRSHKLKSGWIEDVVFSPDGQVALSLAGEDSGGRSGPNKLWEVKSGEELRAYKSNWYSLSLSSNGRLAEVMLKKGIGIVDMASGRILRKMDESSDIFAIAVSPDGRLALSSYRDGTVKIWEAGTGRKLHTLRGHTRWVTSGAFSPDGRLVVTGAADKTLRLWDVASGKELRTLKGHPSEISTVVFSPDGRKVVSGSLEGTAKIWEIFPR